MDLAMAADRIGTSLIPHGSDAKETLTDERIIANDAYWREEEIVNELSAGALQDLELLLRGPWSGAPERIDWSAVFTEGAQIASLVPADYEEPEELTSGVLRRRWRDVAEGDSVALGPAPWMAALRELHRRAKRVRWAATKPREIEQTDYGVRVRLKWGLNRELDDGSIHHDRGEWDSEWVSVGAREWRCRRLAARPGGETLVSSAPHFVDATVEAFAGTTLDPRRPAQPNGARQRGLALGDLDADGDLDLVVSIPTRFLYNRGDGSFEDRTAQVLTAEADPTSNSRVGGVLIADFDRDGSQDVLMASRFEPARLYLQRDAKFRSRAIESSSSRVIPTSLAAHDVDGDGWLDVFICGYGAIADPGPDDLGNARNGTANQLLRGRPGGRFEAVTSSWGLDIEAKRWAFAAVFGDPDDDGDFDLYVANDFGPNVLYRNRGGAETRFDAELEGADRIDPGFSMSATWADLDGDLDLDLYVSNMSSTAANRVRGLPGNPEEARLPVNLNDFRRRFSKGNTIAFNRDGILVEAEAELGAKNALWAWGTALFDYDCDGDLDIHCLNGFWTRGVDDGRDL